MNRTGEEQQEIRKILKDYSDERELEKLILMLSCTVLVRKKKNESFMFHRKALHPVLKFTEL